MSESASDATAALWGGQLRAVQFDPATHECRTTVTTKTWGVIETYRLALYGVTELRFHSAIPQPWTYAELTEVHAEFDAQSEQWLVELILWSEDAGIRLRCSRFDLAGERLSDQPEGPGGHLPSIDGR